MSDLSGSKRLHPNDSNKEKQNEPPSKRRRLEISSKSELDRAVADFLADDDDSDASDWYSDDMSMDGAISCTTDTLLCLNRLNIFPIDVNKIIVRYSKTYYYQCQECGYNSPFFNSNKQKYFAEKMGTKYAFYVCDECATKESKFEKNMKFNGYYFEPVDDFENFDVNVNNKDDDNMNDFTMKLNTTCAVAGNKYWFTSHGDYSNTGNWFDDSNVACFARKVDLNLKYNYNDNNEIKKQEDVCFGNCNVVTTNGGSISNSKEKIKEKIESKHQQPKPIKLRKIYPTITNAMPAITNENDIKMFEQMLNNQCELLISNNPNFDCNTKFLIR